jgi:hypothetical protein
VDDFGRNDYDYHPCMSESTIFAGENFYEGLLLDLGYGYDKYDVQGASTGLSNEPWALVTYPDPANPDSVVRRYDAVIWFTSRFDEYTVLDTMQCRLFDFVRMGGNLFMCGNKLGCDFTDYGSYSDAATDTCDFYGGVLGAKMSPPGESVAGILDPDHYAVGTGTGLSQLTASDVFHFYTGCPLSSPHDLTELNNTPPSWSHPSVYLAYEGGGTQVVGIYNYYDDGAGEVGGKVIHMGFDLDTIVDSCAVTCERDYKGRYELLYDILVNVFELVPCLGAVESDFVPSARYATALDQNFPNPFNPDTDINFSLRENGRVSLKIYNVRGQVVKTLVDNSMQAGRHSAHWDGTNDNSQLVSSGIYFCKMEASDFQATKKMILLK